jgi:hypothetical protein
MANEWYYTKGEERIGPISSDQLKSLATSGELNPDDLIWKDGREEWTPASQLRGLFPESSPLTVSSPSSEGTARPQPIKKFSHPPYLQIPIMIASLIFIAAMCLPWWSFRVKGGEEEFEKEFSKTREVKSGFNGGNRARGFNTRTRRGPDKEKLKTLAKNMTSSIGWYVRNVQSVSFKTNADDFIDSGGDEDEIDIQGKIWGWHTTLGIGAGLFGFLVLPLSLVIMISPSVRQYGFAFSFAAAYASFVFIVLSAIWWFDTPGWDMKPLITQQAHVGPYLVMGAGILVLIFGITDGIMGLRAFSRSRKV